MSASQHFGSRVGERSEDPQHSVCTLLLDLQESTAVPGVMCSLPHSYRSPNTSLTVPSEQTSSLVPKWWHLGAGGGPHAV